MKQLHVAQLAAGAAQWQYESSPDDYEITLEVSVLSQALLALVSQPKMRVPTATTTDSGHEDSFAPHLLFLHSIAGFEVTEDWVPPGQSLIERCNDKAKWDPTKQY